MIIYGQRYIPQVHSGLLIYSIKTKSNTQAYPLHLQDEAMGCRTKELNFGHPRPSPTPWPPTHYTSHVQRKALKHSTCEVCFYLIFLRMQTSHVQRMALKHSICEGPFYLIFLRMQKVKYLSSIQHENLSLTYFWRIYLK